MTGAASSVLVSTGIDALIAIVPLAALLLLLQRVLLKLPHGTRTSESMTAATTMLRRGSRPRPGSI